MFNLQALRPSVKLDWFLPFCAPTRRLDISFLYPHRKVEVKLDLIPISCSLVFREWVENGIWAEGCSFWERRQKDDSNETLVLVQWKESGERTWMSWKAWLAENASAEGLLFPKQQRLFANCQNVSLQEDGGNYIFTAPMGRDSNCRQLVNKIWLNVGVKRRKECSEFVCWMDFCLPVHLFFFNRNVLKCLQTEQMWLVMN